MEKQTLKLLGKGLREKLSPSDELPLAMRRILRSLANAKGERDACSNNQDQKERTAC